MPTRLRDGFRDLRHFVNLLLLRFREDRCLQLASSLTFTTLLSLVPLITIMLTLFSAFPVFGKLTANLDKLVTGSVLPEGVGEVVRGYLQQFTRNAAGLTALGVALLSVTAFALMVTIERAFNAIWRIRRERPFTQRVTMYWATITLGPVLIGASLTMTSYVVSISLGWAGEAAQVQSTVFRAAPYLFTIAAFTLLYCVVPNRPIIFRHALIGGAVAGVLFELVKLGFAFYIAHFPTYVMVYGAFATFPVFLLWVYLSWVITALGAEVTALLPDWRKGRPSALLSPRGERFLDALEVLRVLISAQRLGETPDERDLVERAGLPRDLCDAILADLEAAGWVARVNGARWVLVCDPQRVTLAQVFRALLFDVEGLQQRLDDSGLSEAVRKSVACAASTLETIPIFALLPEGGQGNG